MFNTEFLLKVLKREKISHYIYSILFLSLFTLGDFLTLYIFSELIGIFLYLGLIALLCFIGVAMVVKLFKATITKLEDKHDNGIYPKEEFYGLTALLLASVLVVFPGIVTSLVGFIIIIPYFRQKVGRKITKRLKLDWYAVYEYREIYNN